MSDDPMLSFGDVKAMTRYVAGALICFLTVLAGETAVSQESPSAAAIENAVKRCVAEVHKTDSYSHFDAYYNPATKAVENTVTYVADQGALYLFRKCMASQRLPLK